MKSVLVIGMGKLGKHLALKLSELGNEVVVADIDPKSVEGLTEIFTDIIIGDCTSEQVLKDIGVNNFDICFVTIGEHFQASLEITSSLADLGAKCIISKSNGERQTQILKKIGATEIFYPEKEIANKLAVQYNANNIFDFVELTNDYSIFEIPILPKWAGESISELDIRKKYKINVIAVKKGKSLIPNIERDYIFDKDDHIMVIGKSGDVFKLVAKT